MSTVNPYWNGKTVFVTGASGFVGSWLTRELLDAGAIVVALVRDTNRPGLRNDSRSLGKLVLRTGTVDNYVSVSEVIGAYLPEIVFHLAAQSQAGAAKRDPLATLETNVRGTWNVLEAARQNSVGRVVVASSDKAYGTSSDLPLRETHPMHGRFPYDVSKSCADLISGMYAQTYGLPVAMARSANVFGGGDLNFSRLIPDLVRTTIRGERFVIHSDGKFVRDFVYVRDVVRAYLLLGEKLQETPQISGEAFNFGCDEPVTVLDVVEKVLSLMGVTDLRPIIKDQASSEVRESYLCSDKAKRLLGWTPSFHLEQGLRETIAWYQNYLAVEAAMEAAG